MKLVLFDLDGTILLTGGAGTRALNTLIERRYGISDAFRDFDFGGKTDPGIFREVFENNGIGSVEEEIHVLEEEYLRLLAGYLPESAARLMPGFPGLLEDLDRDPDIQLGLLTGNFERGARIKLGHFDLNRYLPFGAYGSDSEDRNRLVSIAVKRAAEYLRRPVRDGRNVVIVGDTVRDIECGRANGAITVVVATGGSTMENLKEHEPDAVFADFSDSKAAAECLRTIT